MEISISDMIAAIEEVEESYKVYKLYLKTTPNESDSPIYEGFFEECLAYTGRKTSFEDFHCSSDPDSGECCPCHESDDMEDCTSMFNPIYEDGKDTDWCWVITT